MNKAYWMVRAQRGGRLIDDFRDKTLVAIGWVPVGDLSIFSDRESMTQAVKIAWPEWKPGKVGISESQLYRFAKEMEKGDRILSYDPQSRRYLVGTIVGDYVHDPSLVEEIYGPI